MKRKLIAASLLALSATASFAADTAQSPWMVFVRVAHLNMDNDTSVAGLEVENKTIPDISIRYSFSQNLAAELLLTVPQKHDVSLAGANIGSFKHLPPTLFAQYHFDTQGDFKPYVGAGINYTDISSVNLLGGAGGLEDDSWGAALQAGFDYKVTDNGYISVDLKKIFIDSDVKVGGATIGKTNLDPTVFSIGYGFRF